MTSDWSNFTRQQLIDAIRQMEKTPHKKAEILGNLGIVALGGGGGAAAAAVLGAGSTAIPIVTALTGVAIAVPAAPLVIAGGAVAGAGVLFGTFQKAKNDAKNKGKREEILRQLKDQLRDLEQKDRSKTVTDEDKTKLYTLLADAMELKENPMDKDDAADLMNAVEKGEMPLKDAYEVVMNFLQSN